ncbi:MAG: GGDEF domain-containing phosphodiesterase [Lachnospiraceae bacterium]|jgi:EAL domain-containing protein (putative c-di-GMP-specific phosphodiesterase class I)|nr:GGDEF domain-containing phosphodiesterase [Lachnospiraceae bacterium]MEE3460270.1 GGDEF domain-containing phosphodiesterase [Lachnospiraceae bacterium]
MKVKTYNPQEIRAFMDQLKDIYPIVRLVDPEECRVLSVAEDGKLSFTVPCYEAWHAGVRCANCISYRASQTQKPMSKLKPGPDNDFNITSVPVFIKNGNTLISCNLETGTIEPKKDDNLSGLDKAIEKDVNNAEYLITHDILTRLYSVEGFYRKARTILIAHPDKTYLIVALNVKRFSLVNTMFGRSYGNSVIISIADMLREEKIKDAIYAYDSAEGFLCLIKEDDTLEDRLNEIISEARRRFSTPGFMFSMRAGIYEIKDPNIPLSVMVERAVLAIKKTSQSRLRAITWFSENMLTEELHEQYVVSVFDKTLTDNRFKMYLQPQVDKDGRILGTEALVRCFREDGNIAPPDTFVGILEKSEQISQMDRYMWEQAACKLSEWKEKPAFKDLYISVNVSPKDIYTMDVPEVFRDICQKYGVDPAKLHVEITETSVLNDINNRARNIEKLQGYGFTVEIDDFGKGSSSLAMLSKSNADVLKIDREFIIEIQTSPKAHHILSSVIDLIKSINMHSIVEGVETREQLDILTAMGCRVFQGYYFSKPLPPEELEKKYA